MALTNGFLFKGWVDEYGRWHSGATTQTIVTSVLAVPAALAVGLMAL